MLFKTKKDLIDALISEQDSVLDIGFWGQGIDIDNPNWPHGYIKNRTKQVFGLDIKVDTSKVSNPENYFIGNAENFHLEKKIDVIFAGDLIEHLSNMGLFLECCKEHLKTNGRLILITPNCFNLFNIAGKITREEPVVNHDHTVYFNTRTIRQLLAKNNWSVVSCDYLDAQKYPFKESLKKKILNVVYLILARMTNKFHESIIVVASPNSDQ